MKAIEPRRNQHTLALTHWFWCEAFVKSVSIASFARQTDICLICRITLVKTAWLGLSWTTTFCLGPSGGQAGGAAIWACHAATPRDAETRTGPEDGRGNGSSLVVHGVLIQAVAVDHQLGPQSIGATAVARYCIIAVKDDLGEVIAHFARLLLQKATDFRVSADASLPLLMPQLA